MNNIRKGNALDVDEDPVKSVSALEQALVVVNRVSNEVNEALSQNERSHKILGLWARIGRPENFLQPGRELLYLCKVEMAQAWTHKERRLTVNANNLPAVLSDILVFARPTAGLFASAGDSESGDRDQSTWTVASFDPGKDSASHHLKHLTLIEHLDVSTSLYSCTQPRGDCGIDARVLANLIQRAESPYRSFAIWCETPEAKVLLKEKIEGALQGQLHILFEDLLKPARIDAVNNLELPDSKNHGVTPRIVKVNKVPVL